MTNCPRIARATVFLHDEQGKGVGQKTQWVIGGTKDRPALAPGAKTTFTFVIPIERGASSNLQARVIFNRIILEGGKVADVTKSVQITPAAR